jgi:hypothetical protein
MFKKTISNKHVKFCDNDQIFPFLASEPYSVSVIVNNIINDMIYTLEEASSNPIDRENRIQFMRNKRHNITIDGNELNTEISQKYYCCICEIM